MTCAICYRAVLVTWALGDGRGVCDGCIRRCIRQAERALFERQSRIALERWRRLGFDPKEER